MGGKGTRNYVRYRIRLHHVKQKDSGTFMSSSSQLEVGETMSFYVAQARLR